MNAYAKSINARLATALAANCSASNEKKMRKLAVMCNDELAQMLEDAKIDAERLTRAIYACEKVIKFASQAVRADAANLNENTFAIFKTAINCYRHDVTLTRTMCEASISRSVSVDDSVKHVVAQRAIIQTSETIAAQTQTSIDALITLKILTVSATSKHAYNVKMTKVARAICKNFELETVKVKAE